MGKSKKRRRLDTDADVDILREVIRSCFQTESNVGEALVAGALLEVASAIREHSGMVDDHVSTSREFVETLMERMVPEEEEPAQEEDAKEDGQTDESSVGAGVSGELELDGAK